MNFGAFIHFAFLWSLCISTLFVPSRGLGDVAVEDSRIPCDDGWMLFGQYCYKAEKEPLTWNMASVRCASLGGHLASIHSQEEQDFLTAYVLLEEKAEPFWIGMHDKFNDNKLIWEDGSDVNYTYWLPGEPTHIYKSKKEDCVEMHYEYNYKGSRIHRTGWNDLPCERRTPYICQKEKNEMWFSENPLICSSGNESGQKFRGSCYKLVFENKTWEDAEQYCQDNFNGHLVTISDSRVDWFLNYALRNFKGPFWVGIKLRNQLQQKWASGWHVAYNFLQSDSSLVHGKGFCVVRSRPELWIETPCHHDYPFICEALKDDPPKLKNSLKGWKCPEPSNNWKDLDGDFCYHFDTLSSVTWYKAHVECLRMGGHLTSIHSQEESDILQPFVLGNKLFIGLNTLLSDGTTFSWSDGTQLNYTHWEQGEPNDDNEKCVELLSNIMKWNDISCSVERGFICSVRKVPSDNASNKVQCNVAAISNENSSETQVGSPGVATNGSVTVKEVCVRFKTSATEADFSNIWSTEIHIAENNKKKIIIDP